MKKRCSSCKKLKATKEFHRNRAQRDGFQNQCKSCKGKVNKAYLENNPGKRKETIANYYARNGEVIREKLRIYKQENPERRREVQQRSQQKTYAENPEKFREKARQWREENPERYREIYLKAYRKAYDADPEPFKRNAHRRRARQYQAPGYVSDDINEILMSLQDGCCYYCDGDLLELSFHQDHMIPLVRGGLHDDSNLVLACPPCNLSKGAQTAAEFIGEPDHENRLLFAE